MNFLLLILNSIVWQSELRTPKIIRDLESQSKCFLTISQQPDTAELNGITQSQCTDPINCTTFLLISTKYIKINKTHMNFLNHTTEFERSKAITHKLELISKWVFRILSKRPICKSKSISPRKPSLWMF